MKSPTPSPIRMKGFTLVELLLALAISSALLAGVFQVLIASKTVYRVQENLSRMQESGRYAMDAMSRDLRMAGYRGCIGNNGPLHNHLHESGSDITELANQFSVAVEAVNNIASNDITRYRDERPFTGTVAPVAGSDVLILRRPEGQAMTVVEPTQAGQMVIQLPATGRAKIEAGDRLLIADCHKARIFQVNRVAAGPQAGLQRLYHLGRWGGPEHDLDGFFNPNDGMVEVVPMKTLVYYVRPSTAGSGFSLYRQDDQHSAQELLSNVDDLQLQFGVDLSVSGNGRVDHYLDATAVESRQLWPQVVSVQLALQTVSEQDYLQSPAVALPLPGSQRVVRQDGRLRRTFSTLVTLRNRAL